MNSDKFNFIFIEGKFPLLLREKLLIGGHCITYLEMAKEHGHIV